MKRLRAIVPALLLAAAAPPAAAQSYASPYIGERGRDIKSLSDEEVRQLLDGEGMGLAKAAELNGMPGPRHVLDMAGPLGLTRDQERDTDDVFRRMQAGARALGREIVSAERSLDRDIADGRLDGEELERRTVALGTLWGALRAVHLRAHLEMMRILTPRQVGDYARLRYAAAMDDERGAPSADTPPSSMHHH